MKPGTNGKKDKEEFTPRRKYIFQNVVLQQRTVSLAEFRVANNAPTYNERNAKTDVDFFCSIGCDILFIHDRRNPSRDRFIFTGRFNDADYERRKDVNEDEKQLVAKVAAGLICGLSDVPEFAEELLWPGWMDGNQGSDTIEEFLKFSSAVLTDKDKKAHAALETILDHFNLKVKLTNRLGEKHRMRLVRDIQGLMKHYRTASAEKSTALIANLKMFWGETNRLVAIDSGSTNLILAKELAKMRVPLPGSHLTSLTVCTNSREIFQELGPPEVQVKCIMVGGQQKFQTPTVAGPMAEMFLRNTSMLQFGMCLLGASRIDLDKLHACSDSQEEASMKTLFMDKSSIRVVCIDSSKLEPRPGRESYRFASLDPNHINLVITNSPLINRGAHFETFRRSVGTIQSRGVPVLVATSDGITHEHPFE